MIEVPIVFPSQGSAPQRYVVDDANKVVQRLEESSKKKPSASEAWVDGSSYGLLCGSSSMSPLTFSSGATAILTTSTLMEDPGILVVALAGSDSQKSPVTVELDLQSAMSKDFGHTVKVQAFVQMLRNGMECVRLVLVSNNAVVVTLRLHPESLETDSDLEVLKIKEISSEQAAGSTLTSTMVGFASPFVIVIALSPLLMSINLHTQKCEEWRESQCKEDMKARQSTYSSLKSTAANMVFGRPDDGVVDMRPTSALCISSSANMEADPTFVFTLHSDGTIRRWTVTDQSLFPLEVYPISIRSLPDNKSWSDVHNAVYLSARLYKHIYVLAAHIQTDSPNDDPSNPSSNDHVVVASGYQDCRDMSPEISSQVLEVPSRATGLIGMDFAPGKRAALLAMFRSSADDNHAGTTIAVRYPPSVVSIVENKPYVYPVEDFLDGVAQMERARMDALGADDELEGTSALSLEDELHEIDARFMKHLFRPAHPRGIGSMTAPADRHIRTAISKVLYGRMRYIRTEGMSIELETLRAMQDWCSTENRKLMALTPRKKSPGKEAATGEPAPKMSATSVYDSYVAASEAGAGDEMETEDLDSVVDSTDGERIRLLGMHASRWRRLLAAIWEEEQSVRLPLGLYLLPSSIGELPDSAVIVRAGFTSIVVGDSPGNAPPGALTELDEAALKLIKLIESNPDTHRQILSIERRIWRNIATPQADDMEPSDFAEEFSRVVDIAFDLSRGALFSVQEQKRLGQSLEAASLDSLLQALQQVKGKGIMNESRGSDDFCNHATVGSQFANSHLRQAVNSFSARCIDSSRRLLLARYLLILHLVRSSQLSTASFHLYVRSLAVGWVGAQRVATPSSTKSTPSLFRRTQRPKLRQGATTSAMDALLSSIPRPALVWECPTRLVVSLSQEIHGRSFKPVLMQTQNLGETNGSILPELSALPGSSNHGTVTDYPNLALRLMSPIVALSSRMETPNVANLRKETLAQCILMHVDSDRQRMTAEEKSAMRVKACELLAMTSSGAGSPRQVKAALEILQQSSQSMSELQEQEKISLAQELQRLVYDTRGEIRNEVIRLANLDTVKTLFVCLVRHMDERSEAAVKLLLPKFMFLSSLMRRVDILQDHVSPNKEANVLILSFIKGAIADLHDIFPPEFSVGMPENQSLYNRLFHVAVSAGEWSQAFDACVNNPASNRRIESFKTLVSSMADAGAMGEMLDKFSLLTTPTPQSQPLDLYDIAVDTLEEQCSQDLYSVRANSLDPSIAAPDHAGALYALHVSRGEWRKAAQALDLRFTNALRSLGRPSGDRGQASNFVVAREKLIVEDVVLASTAAANVLSLVEETAAQFLISGDKTGSNSRIDQFVTCTDLLCRAVWSLIFRKLAEDRSTDLSEWCLSPSGVVSPFVDRAAIDLISEGGYFLCHLLLAIAVSKTSASPSLPKVLFEETLDQLLDRVFPQSSEHVPKSRPSLSQLRYMLSSLSISPAGTPFVSTSRIMKRPQRIQAAGTAASSALLQKLTYLQTDADHPYGLHVAQRFLDKGCLPPDWLEGLLISGTALFPGDPSALLSLYLRRGMVLEACSVACAMLDSQKEKAATQGTGLPEKGDIYFLPHKKIDILWNLLEIALRKEGIDPSTKSKVIQGQQTLCKGLEEHFERIQRSELGLRSMRTLNSPGFF
ncbi:expressed unknown protein [Seminavis robusta]|uniref:Uncharacterized protein n=1 Tax=Seminavis robusta TaxID=568900 RepID=A0A9N8E546_9STRA|nr:expressed unknown protein [Seminavis robusta]|eukprot:Sro627_g177920.1 n/a (1667) ;mRNA; f:39176-44339